MLPEQWAKLRHFTAAEFGVGAEHMDAGFIAKLEQVRELAGVPMVVTSGYRDGDDLSHGRGYAADVSDNGHGEPCGSRWFFHVAKAALEVGFNRIGWYKKHIHLDADPSLPPDVMWVALDR